jgi:hypothetical protein
MRLGVDPPRCIRSLIRLNRPTSGPGILRDLLGVTGQLGSDAMQRMTLFAILLSAVIPASGQNQASQSNS